MKALLQRASEARVEIDGAVVGRCGSGLVILVCAMRGDAAANADMLAGRIAMLRVFRNEDGRMNRSLPEAGGGALEATRMDAARDRA